MISTAPHVHAVTVEDDLVILDLNTDAYLCLPQLAAHLVHQGQGLWSGDAPDLELGLIATGLFQASHQTSAPQPSSRPRRTSRTYSHGDPVARFDAPFLTAAIRHFGRIHGRPLKRLIEQSPRVPLRPDDAGIAMAQARLFDRWMPWLPGQGQCVYRAYLLRACLAAQGLGSTWIFGVRTWPFSAHCWLQIGDVLLDDDLDRVGLYTPILAVGP